MSTIHELSLLAIHFCCDRKLHLTGMLWFFFNGGFLQATGTLDVNFCLLVMIQHEMLLKCSAHCFYCDLIEFLLPFVWPAIMSLCRYIIVAIVLPCDRPNSLRYFFVGSKNEFKVLARLLCKLMFSVKLAKSHHHRLCPHIWLGLVQCQQKLPTTFKMQ